jgi:hypothetical protein
MTMTPTADQKTLEPLDVFVGEWSMATSFVPNPADAPRARTTFEWLPGRRFRIQRWEVERSSPSRNGPLHAGAVDVGPTAAGALQGAVTVGADVQMPRSVLAGL